jgi:hypothetical protein
MYNPEITNLINQNFELGFAAHALIKEYEKTRDPELVVRVEQISQQQKEIHNTIVKMRGEN